MTGAANKIQSLSSFAWSIADILRGDFKQSEYGKIVLPFIVMRRLDCILEASKDAVLEAAKTLPKGVDDETKDMILYRAVGGNIKVYNLSRFTFRTLHGQDPGQLHENLIDYIRGFSANVRDIFFDKFLFTDQLKRLKEGGILWQVFDRFCQINLHPDRVSNIEMGYLFEELIRRFSEISNETAGEHFTPREVIRLIVELLLANDHAALSGTGIIRTVYDPACGTGGMLAITEEEMKALNPKIRVELFGQELNGESFGICKSDMLVTGHDPEQITFGNTLTNDAHKGKAFHYMLSNPPYGVDWKKYQDPIKEEAETLGFKGRFGAGTPRVSDGQLLFLQHMISKMRDDEQGSRIGIVMNGSPLFTGGAGSGESEIRRWMLENDWVEAIVALPTDLFYNTGIQTYVWLLNNRKPQARQQKVQLINASSERFCKSMKKSLGSKRREVPEEARKEIVRIYEDMLNGGGEWAVVSKILDVTDFGYREIRIERPLRLNFQATPDRIERLKAEKAFLKLEEAEQQAILACLRTHLPTTLFTDRIAFDKALNKALKAAGLKIGATGKKAILSALSERDEEAEACTDRDGNPEPDPDLRDHELVPLKDEWEDFIAREVTPFVPDAWVDTGHRDARDGEVGRVGYEINFNRYFYNYVPPRPLEIIDAELKQLESQTASLLKEVANWCHRVDANMKLSDVEWIGEIPAHWTTPKLTHIARLESGHTPSRAVDAYWVPGECVIPWFTLSDIWQVRREGRVYVEDTKEKISALGLANSAARLLPKDTVILSRTASVGFPAILGKPMATSQDFVNWICGPKIRPKYLYYVLRSMGREFSRLMMGSTHQTIYMPDVKSFRVPLPPIHEQDEIVEILDASLARYNSLIEKTEARIGLLQEFCSSLITSATTGPIAINGRVSSEVTEPIVSRRRVRVVVGAEIVDRHRATKKFGRVKFQKLLYLAEAHVGIHELDGTYLREPAGPLDRDLLEETERGMAQAELYRADAGANGNGAGIAYIPLAKAGSHRKELADCLGDRAAELGHVIDLVKDFDTRIVEAITTLYAVWNDALIDGRQVNDHAVIDGVLNEWHPEKKDKFQDANLQHWLDWMRRNGLAPKGCGPKTLTGRLFP